MDVTELGFVDKEQLLVGAGFDNFLNVHNCRPTFRKTESNPSL